MSWLAGADVRIHPTAVVDPGALLDAGVDIGPYAVIEGSVVIGAHARIGPHAVVYAGTELGESVELHAGAAVGGAAQVRGLAGPGGRVRIGPRTIVREHATVHRAARPAGCTVVGRDVMLLAGAHVAHDCVVGDEVTLANGALLAGGVTLGNRTFLSGNVVVHQHVQIGALAMIGGLSRVSKDVPPFMLVVGDSLVHGLNVVGLRRAGVSPERRRALREAYSVLYRGGLPVSDAVCRIAALPETPEITALLAFIAGARRGICAAANRARVAEEAGE